MKAKKTKGNLVVRGASLALLVSSLISATSLVAAPPTAPSGRMWESIPELSDEFKNGFDTNKWTKPLWNYGVPVNMIAQNSGVSNDNLWIRATEGSGSRWFNTSRVMSRAQIKFPMYIECRMRTSNLSAYSTFWLNNGDINNRDEIDICEHNTNPSWPNQPNRAFTMYSQYFIAVNGNTERNSGNFDNRNLSANNPARGKKWNEEYQVLGCWWKDKNNVQFYINGEPAGSVRSTRNFTRNLNVIWDLWTIDASWAGGIARRQNLRNNNINTMYVDWVRTYKLVNDPNASSTPPATLTFDNNSNYQDQSFQAGSNLAVTVNYSAGPGRTVNGNGIKYWLRLLNSNYSVVRDVTTTNTSVAGTASGTATGNIAIPTDATPTANLAAGQFYFLFASFTDSAGTPRNIGLQPLIITAPRSSVPTAGSVITLLGNNNRYVSSENGVNPMTCNRPAVGAWERFTVVDAGGGRFALRGNNNRFVTAATPITCNSTQMGDAQKFSFVEASNGKVALKSGNFYASSENGSGAMNWNRMVMGGWEQFTWTAE